MKKLMINDNIMIIIIYNNKIRNTKNAKYLKFFFFFIIIVN